MRTSIIVTSINAPNPILKCIADGASGRGWDFIVIGDSKSPPEFSLEGCLFLSVDDQHATGLRFAKVCPTGHYARKNIGYLLAKNRGAELIVETDDDNYPRDSFFGERSRKVEASIAATNGWVNVYGYFSDANIWPRGLPLDEVRKPLEQFERLPIRSADCPIQQGLADENPDVDAIYRLLLPLPQNFRSDRRIALGNRTWCPFNSQNTTWWRDAFPLLYLPAYCSFRMTDIWRSFVAQRIIWEMGWQVLFHEPTVWQQRNDHNLMRDFADEIPGYLHNDRIRRTLEDLPLSGGQKNMPEDLRRCYKSLVSLDVVGSAEIPLLDAWIADLDRTGEGG
jgi:hypothetical protein